MAVAAKPEKTRCDGKSRCKRLARMKNIVYLCVENSKNRLNQLKCSMMKKMYNYLVLLAALTMGLTFASCDDEDVSIAMNLSGDWQGDFGMYFSDGWREYDAAYTYLRFTPRYDYATEGMGEEIDFFDVRSPIRSQSFLFKWRVVNGVLQLRYLYAPELDVDIRNYVMDRNYFSGRVANTTFTLGKLYDYYGWYGSTYDDYYGHYNDYYGYGGYGDYGYNRDYYYYGKTRTADADSTDTASAPTITMGRRFK